MLHGFADIHTHRIDSGVDAVISVGPDEIRRPDRFYSVGVHPWYLAETGLSDGERRALVAAAADSRVVAIGEAGIDLLRGPDPEVQQEAFMEQAAIAADSGKALIIHCVRAWHILIRLRAIAVADARRRGIVLPPWIVHGFRGGPALARQLLDAGFDLSFGLRYNKESFDITPTERRYRETDAL